MKKITVLILLACVSAFPVEPAFISPSQGDTLNVGDSVTVRLTAPAYPAHSGKHWSLVLVIAPKTARESYVTLVDTVFLPADTTTDWARRFPVPRPSASGNAYAFGLQYHPAMNVFQSPAFIVVYADPEPPASGAGMVVGRKVRIKKSTSPGVYRLGSFLVDAKGRGI